MVKKKKKKDKCPLSASLLKISKIVISMEVLRAGSALPKGGKQRVGPGPLGFHGELCALARSPANARQRAEAAHATSNMDIGQILKTCVIRLLPQNATASAPGSQAKALACPAMLPSV